MFLTLSKILDHLLAPLSWAVALGLAAMLLRGRPRLARGLLVTGLAILVLAASPRMAGTVFRLAERGAVTTARPNVVYDAVVVLGGMVDTSVVRVTGQLELSAAGDRLVRGWEVVRSGQARTIVLSAGLMSARPGDVTEAELCARKLAEWGIAPERILAEPRSRNTRENAVEVARLVRERGWKNLLLITSAVHLERALGCFRAVGLTPDALPVDFHGGDGRDEGWLPRASALSETTDALREVAGRAIYRLVGYTRENRP